ncbi:MAG TPA: adenylate kinase [Ruminococcaceae bacterium]|nr:adenylate kinase [Oscillospiraceae bacterium]
MKAIVIGCPGSGKSTFARKLSKYTNTPLCYLDKMNWNSDKTTVTREVFDKRLSEVMQKDEWIIDGNYMRTMEIRMAKADVIYLFDLPTDVCLDGVRERLGKKHEDLPWIENEIDDGFIDFIKNFKTESVPKIYELTNKFLNKKIIVFRSREDAENYLQIIKEEPQKV